MGRHELPLAHRLRELGEEMIQVAGQIGRGDHLPPKRSVPVAPEQEDDKCLLAAREIYHQRLRRRAHFAADLFGEPAWDILLDLFIAAKEGRQIAVTSACLGAQVPLTTALRWLQQLEAAGLVVRHQDESDGRRRLVRISDHGYARMRVYLADQRTVSPNSRRAPEPRHRLAAWR